MVSLVVFWAEQVGTEEVVTSKYLPSKGGQPTDLAEAIKTLTKQGCGIFVEVDPGLIQRKIGRIGLPEEIVVWLLSLEAEKGNWQRMLWSVGELYVRGASVDWFSFDRDYSRRRLQRHTYPFQLSASGTMAMLSSYPGFG